MEQHPQFRRSISTSDYESDKCNRLIARRYLRAVLAARAIVFQAFRKLAEGFKLEEQRQQHLWTLLQVAPATLLGMDVFESLRVILLQSPESYVYSLLQATWAQITVGISQKLYLIFDESQQAIKKYDQAFLSMTPTVPIVHRPVLHVLASTCVGDSLQSPLIFSGTGLQAKFVWDIIASGSGKAITVHKYHNTGSFISEVDQKKYLTRYLWPGQKPEALTGDALRLVNRAWQWLRGRYVLR